jgi:replicative DNA helicase|tara:strand:- start:1066 stop:2436 length:1371 start_codon:yes stop_codon:yes gene_type:complete
MIENNILHGLIVDEEYTRKCLPFVQPEYFSDPAHKLLFKMSSEYFAKYNTVPNRQVLDIELGQVGNVDQQTVEAALSFLNTPPDPVQDEWLMDETEKFCQDKAIYNAVMDGINILENKPEDKGQLPELLQKALQVSFDNSVGHDFIDDSESRYDFYHQKETRVPFDLELMNKITKGGIPNKTLNIILAGTGVGKSLFMCHMAAAQMCEGKNVLYITMEMAEERIAERIDANLLDVTMEDLAILPKESYEKKMARLQSKTVGKLIIKEYPTATANSNHIRHLIQELKTKKNFKPDIIYIDYLNICASSRLKGGMNAGSYTIIKAIAEELRGLAVEFNVPIVSATQTNRSGYSSSDIGLEDTSESFGLPATADFMVALSQTEELESLNQFMVKQLKNRYADPAFHRRFVIGVDKSKMRLYDVEQTAQGDMMDDGPIFDKGKFGSSDSGSLKDVFKDFT